MTERASYPLLQGRPRPPAFARYAALVAESLEAPAAETLETVDPEAAALDAAALDAGAVEATALDAAALEAAAVEATALETAMLDSAALSAARGLRPSRGGCAAPRPYEAGGAAGPAADAAGASRLDRVG